MEENVKINFLKKIWYSVAKTSKYDNLRKLGLGKAIKYIFSIITVLALIIAIFFSIIQINVVKDAISYLDEKLPEIKFKENALTSENKEATIINDNKIIEYFGNIVVINPLLEKQEAINQYKSLTTEKNGVIIFLSKEYVVISNKYNSESQEGIDSKKYEEVSSKYIKDMSYEYSKKDIIQYLRDRISYAYYIGQFFIIYIVIIIFLYALYTLLISISIWIVTKIIKLKWTFKESLINTIYASTLSMIIFSLYSIISCFIKFSGNFIGVLSIATIFIYLCILIYIQKKKNNK